MMATLHLRRWTAALVAAVALASVPRVSAAADADPQPRTKVSALPKGAVTQRYRSGLESLREGRFAEAGQSFSDVLDLIPETPYNRALRSTVVLDAISAYRAAYDQASDVADLHAALETYYRYFAVYEETYGSPNIPPKVAQARFALKDAIAQAEASEPTESNDHDDQPSTPAESTEPSKSSTLEHGSASQEAAPADRDRSSGGRVAISARGGNTADRSGVPLIAAGAAVLAVGVGASSLIAVGAIGGQRAREDSKQPDQSDEQRDAIDRRGRTMNAVLIAGAISTPVLVGAGAALLGIGIRRHRRARVTAVLPKIRGSFVGITVKGRF